MAKYKSADVSSKEFAKRIDKIAKESKKDWEKRGKTGSSMSQCTYRLIGKKTENDSVKGFSGHICNALDVSKCLDKKGNLKKKDHCKKVDSILKAMAMSKCPPCR